MTEAILVIFHFLMVLSHALPRHLISRNAIAGDCVDAVTREKLQLSPRSISER